MLLRNVEQMKSKLGKLRLFQAVFIGAIALFIWVAESIHPRIPHNWTLWDWGVAGLAVYEAVSGFLVRRTMVRRSEKTLSTQVNAKALKQWEAGHIMGMAAPLSIVLCGVVIRVVLGGALWQASLFYAAGTFLILLWTPRLSTTAASAWKQSREKRTVDLKL